MLKNTLRLLSNSASTNLAPSVDSRISRSTATLRSTGSVDIKGREIGITPVKMKFHRWAYYILSVCVL